MSEMNEPGAVARRLVLRRALGVGAGVVLLIGGAAVAGAADDAGQVVIDNFTFSPTPLQIKAGATVTWVNRDDIPHSIVCPDLSVHSHALDTGDQFSYRFDKAGTFDYMCGLHPHMRGQVVVQA
jgi:plastocyanin